MTAQAETKTITITLDGRQVSAGFREPVLSITRRYGIDIPTLCHHEALEPAGACRLCLVEVERRGRKKIVTACNFPVEGGMEIRTTTEEIRRLRRMTIESLLARCPSVGEIRRLAAKLGVERSRFVSAEDTCILCSLCTRVCETYVTSAIATIERGTRKHIGTFAGEPPEDCVGCGACAEICPTDHIQTAREGTAYRIWDRTFELSVCEVEAARCRACGACEEACPWSIPRVVLRRNTPASAFIDPAICKACGVCVAACPSGAISQPGDQRTIEGPLSVETPAPLLVFSCGRSDLRASKGPSLPDGVAVRELSCAGSVSQAQLLGALASGFAGVLVLGRHEDTCRLDGAEQHARATVRRSDRLMQLAGLGAGRLRFVEPQAGRLGPADAVRSVAESLEPSPLRERIPSEMLVETQDAAIAILTWLSGQEELVPDESAWLASWGLPAATAGRPALYGAAVPYLDLMLEEWLGVHRLGRVLVDALEVLRAFGIDAGVAIGGFRGGERRLVESLPGTVFYSLCGGCGGRVREAGADLRFVPALLADRGIELALPPMAGKVAASKLQAQTGGLAGVGASVAEISEPPPTQHDLALNQAEQQALLDRLDEAERSGARALLVDTPVSLYQYLIAQRRGAWRRTHVQPLLASTVAAAGIEARRAARGESA